MKQTKQTRRARRHAKIRSRVVGTSVRPRLSVHRSITGMYVQLVDDSTSTTLVSLHSRTIKDGDAGERTGKVKVAYLLGKSLAEQAKTKKIDTAVFDRGGYSYHGRVQAIADGARDGGLTF